MYGVLLILVLVVTGGAIAFIGDRLGSKVGKKRLSIFGLRPRHTSIVVTIFTGICITTLTLGVMAAASQNVRTALFGMEKLNRTMAKTQQSLTDARAQLADAQEEQRQASDDLAKSKEEVSKLEAQQKELEARSEQLQEGNRLLEAAKAELLERNGVLMARNDELGALNSQLGSQNQLLSAANTDLKDKNDILTSDNKLLEQRTQDLRQGLITIREGDIVFRAGEVIASGVVRGNRSADEVAKDLESLAQLADRNVYVRSGRDTGENIWFYQPEYNAAVQQIAQSKQDMVVRIVASGNLIQGEAVRASIELYKNSVIYQKNEFIIAKTYHLTGGDETEAEHTVMSFLKDVNAAATERGILQDPIRGSIGVMEGAQFYDVVNSLAALHGNVVLSAFAHDATDALGPLRLNIKVEPIGESSNP